MFFSKACTYCIKAAIFIAKEAHVNKKVNPKMVAHAINSPVSYTAKLLQLMSKFNLIQSFKGPNGGFVILPNVLENLTVKDIYVAIDMDRYDMCVLGLRKCDSVTPCPLHNHYIKAKSELEVILEMKIKDLSHKVEIADAYLKA